MIDEQESLTAKLCSFARAYHSNWDDQKIFDDFLAFDLMGKNEYEEIGQLIDNDFDQTKFNPCKCFNCTKVCRFLKKYITPIPLSRIAWAEEKLNAFIDEHPAGQYVICGAGMDTFAFRNTSPDVRIFELDHPDTQRYKLQKIKKLEWNIPENVHFVPIDFAKDDMATLLAKAGFRRDVPALFAILGVTYYLTLPVFEQTVAKIAQVADKARLIFDFPDQSTFTKNAAVRVRHLSGITERLGEPMRHGYSVAELRKVLSDYSFDIKEHLTPDDIQKQYFKDRADNQSAFENIHFILAETLI